MVAVVARSEDPAPLARSLANRALACTYADLDAATVAKVKTCLRDFIGCACETFELPWARQARAAVGFGAAEGASVIGCAAAATPGDAAFANAVMGHGLVREDMHAGSISHLGIVVLPALLAQAETHRVSGEDFIAAVVVGYEAGGRLGRALLDKDVARIHRPTGITGPLAAALAGAHLRGLAPEAATSALALAANACAGFNQWAHTGGSEMFFQAGLAARNAVTAVDLAVAGAFASPDALEGEAGLFAALGRRERAQGVRLFDGAPEILAVYHKPVPACNFAQTATVAAADLVAQGGFTPADIAAIEVRVPLAGARYPGCDARGPFEHVLQGKMSIQFNVAATLVSGTAGEHNFALLDDAAVRGLIARTTLTVDDALTAAYPGAQGAEVALTLHDGRALRRRLDDVSFASADEVRARFLAALTAAFGAAHAAAVDTAIESLDSLADAGALPRLLRRARGA